MAGRVSGRYEVAKGYFRPRIINRRFQSPAVRISRERLTGTARRPPGKVHVQGHESPIHILGRRIVEQQRLQTIPAGLLQRVVAQLREQTVQFGEFCDRSIHPLLLSERARCIHSNKPLRMRPRA